MSGCQHCYRKFHVFEPNLFRPFRIQLGHEYPTSPWNCSWLHRPALVGHNSCHNRISKVGNHIAFSCLSGNLVPQPPNIFKVSLLIYFQHIIYARLGNLKPEMDALLKELKKETDRAVMMYKWDAKKAKLAFHVSVLHCHILTEI